MIRLSTPSLAATCVSAALALACGGETRRASPDGGGVPDTGPTADTGGPLDTGPRPDVARPPPPVDSGVCTDVVDVVFVMDLSSSMNFVLDELQADMSDVVTAAAELAADPHFGIVGYVDNHALDTSGAMGAVHTDASTLVSAFATFQSVYTDHNRNPGDGPSGPTTQNPICEENSLDALYAAATEFPWRDNATRVIILATDDTFLERPDNYGDRDGDGDTTSTDFPREGDYPAAWTVPEVTTALQTSRIRVFSFTRLTPPGPLSLTRCGTPRRLPWADVSDGWSTPYGANAPIPEETDGQNFDLAGVQSGSVPLAETISNVVVESFCNPPLI